MYDKFLPFLVFSLKYALSPSLCLVHATYVTIDNTCFFYKQHFYKQGQAEIGKNQAKAKQNPEPELLLFENYSYSSCKLSSINNRT